MVVGVAAVDRLSIQFYRLGHPRGSHDWGNQFHLGNIGLQAVHILTVFKKRVMLPAAWP